jgi:phosphatidylcholine synthase
MVAAKDAILRRCAWLIHLYTAGGVVTALVALDFVERHEFRGAFLAMAASLFIDSTDGPLARALQVRRRIPEFDGALLDNIVDYLNYVFVPAVLMLRAELLPRGDTGFVVAILVLLASGYGFSRVDAKTADRYFRGFPSYWNLVAFYLYCLAWPIIVNTAVVVALAVMIFLPVKFIYPNRTIPLRTLTLVLAGVWAATALGAVLRLPVRAPFLLYTSLGFVVYYFIMSFVLQIATPGPGSQPAP